MDFDKIKQNILNSSETSTSESISSSELHGEFEINNFLPEFEPLKLSGKNLAQQYVSAFNTGMNVYQCLNYLQGYVYTLVTAMNETIEAWNTVVPLLEQATKEWTDEEFDYKWSILKPQVIELVTNLTIETFNKAWEDLKPVVIKLAQDTTDAEFKKQWDILKPQVITLVAETTTNKFNEEWENLRPTIIQLSTDTTIAQFNKSWEELKPKVIELSQTTTSNKFDEKWEELRPQMIELAQTTTSNKFDEKWEALQPTLTETVNNLVKVQTTTTFNEKWEELKPQVIELAQTTTSTKFDEKWTELQPTLNTTVENLVNTNLDTFKTTLWQEVTKNDSFPFLLPENFGAVGDDLTDDSEAFNKCLLEALKTGKEVLLSNKGYYIDSILEDINNIKILGVGARIIVNGKSLFNNVNNCYINSVYFFNSGNTNIKLIQHTNNTLYEKCTFQSIGYAFGIVDLDVNRENDINVLLNNCNFYDSGLCSSNPSNLAKHVVNNTRFSILSITGGGQNIGLVMDKGNGETYIFNNCSFICISNTSLSLFNTKNSLEFNNCYINKNQETSIFKALNYSKGCDYIFNNCEIKDNQNNLITLDDDFDSTYYLNVKIINSKIGIKSILNSAIDCSLWLENNSMETKPIINSGTGKVNLVEIQQKYSPESENIFPWTTEPTPTVENNVSLNKIGTDQYYILTESKDKNVKKLDYYFTYNFNYLPTAPYYTNNVFVRDLDLEGYTVKRSFLSDNTCKLKNKSTGELIDYVYLMLDDYVSVTTTKNNPQFIYTTIAMKYLPYFAKLKTDTPIAGYLYVDACISIILEKTSS